MANVLKVGIKNYADVQKVQLVAPVASSSGGGTTNYELLTNKPSINGVTLVGNMTSTDLKFVSENTTEGWASIPDYMPQQGEICLYTDTGKLKIGDGLAYIADLPYLSEAQIQPALDALQAHINDTSVHVSQDDRNTWNAKINCEVIGEVLTFTRD